jgi:hypothetical protein
MLLFAILHNRAVDWLWAHSNKNQSLKHVLLPAILGINCLFQTVISCLQIMKPTLALQVLHGTGNTCRWICVHTYCISFHTSLKKISYKLRTAQTFKLYRFCGFHSLWIQKEVHMLQISCDVWIECPLKHSKKNLPKINKIEAALNSVSRSGDVSRTEGWLYLHCHAKNLFPPGQWSNGTMTVCGLFLWRWSSLCVTTCAARLFFYKG